MIPWLVGRGLNLLGAALPQLADELAFDLFGRTSKGSKPREPAVAGLETHRFDLELGGRRIAAWDWGRGPTVLLAHGWNGHAGQMAAFVAPLVAAGHYVVAFDMPAHARSEGRVTNLSEMADAVLAIGRRLGPVHAVIGHSLGATAAALAIGRGLKVERGVLLAPAADAPTFLGKFADTLGLTTARRRGLEAAGALRVGGSLDQLDLRRVGPSIQAGLLVLHDPADREVPFAHGQAIAEAVPFAQLLPTPSLGHRRILADREVVRKVVGFVMGRRARIRRAAGATQSRVRPTPSRAPA